MDLVSIGVVALCVEAGEISIMEYLTLTLIGHENFAQTRYEATYPRFAPPFKEPPIKSACHSERSKSERSDDLRSRGISWYGKRFLDSIRPPFGRTNSARNDILDLIRVFSNIF